MKVAALIVALALALAPAGDAAAFSEMWLFGGNFPTLNACLGDTLSFVYGGSHNVYLVDNADCNFNANTVEVGPTESGITVTTTLNMTGTFHYACTIPGHCSGGNMNLQVDVASCAPPPAASTNPVLPISSAPPPVTAPAPAVVAPAPVTVSAPPPTASTLPAPSPAASTPAATPVASPAAMPAASPAATPAASPLAATPSTSASTPSPSASTPASTPAPTPAPSSALRAAASAAPIAAGIVAAATLLVSLI